MSREEELRRARRARQTALETARLSPFASDRERFTKVADEVAREIDRLEALAPKEGCDPSSP